MATNMSLRSLLDSDKLKGPNFDSWYRRLRIVLEHERIINVISDPAPEEPPLTAPRATREAYQKYVSDRTTVRYIMLAVMNDEFSRIFEQTQPQDIIQVLKDSFGIPQDVERYKTSCTIFNTKLQEGDSVTGHVLYMIEMIERLGKLGFPLHEQLGKDAILNSLSPSYLNFLDHYKMNKPAVNYHGLLGLLQTYEKDHQLEKKVVNVVGGSETGRRPFKKGKNKKKNKKVQSTGSGQAKKKNKIDMSKAECFHCKKQGHWKRNCPLYVATLDPNRPNKKKK